MRRFTRLFAQLFASKKERERQAFREYFWWTSATPIERVRKVCDEWGVSAPESVADWAGVHVDRYASLKGKV